jgi:cyclase
LLKFALAGKTINNIIMNFYRMLSAVIFTTASLLATGQAPDVTPVTLKMMTGDLYEIHGGSGANGGLYIGSDGVLVIDAKMDRSSVEQTLELIGQLTDKPVKYLVNTHSDGDHVNGNQFYPSSVTIISHKHCREEFFLPGRNGSPSAWLAPGMLQFVPQITFDDRLDLYFGEERVELWYFGRGHTSGDIVVYFPKEKAAFIGDQIFLNRVPLIHVHKGGNSHLSVNYLEWMLESLEAEKFASGHSAIADRQQIKTYISEMKKRQESIAGLMAEGYTLDQILSGLPENESLLTRTIYNEILEKNF